MDYLTMLARWNDVQQKLKELKDEEYALRTALFTGTFPHPREGVNTHTLPDGRRVKGTYTINRKVDQQQLIHRWGSFGLSQDVLTVLFPMKYDLSIKEYKDLDDEHRKRVDTVLEIKPGAPKLEVLPPKDA